MRRRNGRIPATHIPKHTGREFHCEGLRALVNRARNIPAKWSGTTAGHRLSMTFDEAVHNALLGDTSAVPRAQAIMDKVALEIDLPMREWTESPYGAYAVVPEFLAGLPCPMRALRPQPNEASPIGVWFNLCSSGAITPQALLERGIPVLALVMALQTTRPVDLYIVYSGNGCRVKITVDTRPLDLATACFALCDANFNRHLVMGILREMSGAYIARGTHDPKDLRSEFSIPENDIVVSTGYLYSADTQQLLQNPVKWIQDTLALYLNEREG